eukprot:6184907-Pleurochrysis_carterae.AAC.4
MAARSALRGRPRARATTAAHAPRPRLRLAPKSDPAAPPSPCAASPALPSRSVRAALSALSLLQTHLHLKARRAPSARALDRRAPSHHPPTLRGRLPRMNPHCASKQQKKPHIARQVAS